MAEGGQALGQLGEYAAPALEQNNLDFQWLHMPVAPRRLPHEVVDLRRDLDPRIPAPPRQPHPIIPRFSRSAIRRRREPQATGPLAHGPWAHAQGRWVVVQFEFDGRALGW